MSWGTRVLSQGTSLMTLAFEKQKQSVFLIFGNLNTGHILYVKEMPQTGPVPEINKNKKNESFHPTCNCKYERKRVFVYEGKLCVTKTMNQKSNDLYSLQVECDLH